MDKKGVFASLDNSPIIKVISGISARPVYCDDKIMVILFEVENEVPMHSHSSLQFGLVLSGKAKFTIDDKTKIVGRDSFYYIPSNIVHGVKVLEKPFKALDVFMPPREDYKYLFTST